MFAGFCWFFWSCPLDSAWSSASASLESRWFFFKFFWSSSCDSVVNLQHSGLDLWHSFVSVSLAFWSSDHVDVSTHGYLCWDWCWPWPSGSSEWSWQEEQGGHQVSVQSAAGDLCLQGCQRWQGLCAQLWPVHICCSERQGALGVTCFLFDFFYFRMCLWFTFVFSSLLVIFLKFLNLLRMEQYLGSGGPPCLWKWICLMAWLSCACELLYQSIDAGMSSLNVAAVRRNLVLVWNEFLGWLLRIIFSI